MLFGGFDEAKSSWGLSNIKWFMRISWKNVIVHESFCFFSLFELAFANIMLIWICSEIMYKTTRVILLIIRMQRGSM